MTAHPTGTTGPSPLRRKIVASAFAWRMIAALALLTSSLVGIQARAADGMEHASELRTLAVRIKSAIDDEAHGLRSTASALASMRADYESLRRLAAHNPDRVFAAKLRATATLLTQLRNGAASIRSTTMPSTSRVDVDLEVVRQGHGDSCESALGISTQRPVVATLPAAADDAHGIWLRFEPDASGFARFATESRGPDPAIEVYASCAETEWLASNDDTIGLDAVAVVPASSRRPLFAHVSNGGPAGTVRLAVETATRSISGKVTDADSGQPIPNASISVLTTIGSYVGVQYTDTNGNYTIAPFFAGNFLVLAQANLRVSELYPDAQCGPGYASYGLSVCAIAGAQQVAVADGEAVTGIDFVLGSGHEIAGTVRGGSPAMPIPADVLLYDDAGNVVEYTSTDANTGAYRFEAIAAGSYHLSADSGAYGSQLFDHIGCGGPLQNQCDGLQGTAVVVNDADVSAIDFDLPLLAVIRGSVTGSDQPLIGTSTVVVTDSFGNALAQANTDQVGRYSVGPVPVGSFYVYAFSGGYFAQLYDGVDCGVSCLSNLASATPVVIGSPGAVGLANFVLHPYPSVHGHVQDALSNAPIANAEVRATTFSYGYTNTFTDINGDYTIARLQPGQYYVWALSNNHVDQIYSGIPCEVNVLSYVQTYDCDLQGATLLTISNQSVPPDFDFALSTSSSIGGHATVRTGMPSALAAANVGVTLYDGAGHPLANATTDAQGNYSIADLAPGTYYAVASGGNGSYYVSEVWPSNDCLLQCLPVSGDPIVVGPSEAVSNIDFDILRVDAIVGRVVNSDGNPLPGTYVDLFASGDQHYVDSSITDGAGYYVVRADTGSGYFLATSASEDYFDQVYSGITCPLGAAYYGLCSFDGATIVAVAATAAAPHVANFVLTSRDPIFGNGFEPQ